MLLDTVGRPNPNSLKLACNFFSGSALSRGRDVDGGGVGQKQCHHFRL